MKYLSYVIYYSAAKAPFLARFKVQKCGVKELEAIGMTLEENSQDDETESHASSAAASAAVRHRRSSCVPPTESGREYWQACIFKVGDDVRQVSKEFLGHCLHCFVTIGITS